MSEPDEQTWWQRIVSWFVAAGVFGVLLLGWIVVTAPTPI